MKKTVAFDSHSMYNEYNHFSEVAFMNTYSHANASYFYSWARFMGAGFFAMEQ